MLSKLGWLVSLVMSAAAFAAPQLNLKVVSQLDRFEPFDAHVFHDGRLWVGRSRNNLAAEYRLEIYDPDGTQIAVKQLTHSLRYLYPYGANGVLTLGVSVTDQLTHYSIITRRGSSYQVQTKKIPLGAFANEWGGKPGQLFFTDPGGLDDGGPLGQAARTIFSFNGSSKYLQARVRLPRYPLLVGNSLYVVENLDIASGGRHLVKIDLKTQQPTRLYTGANITNAIAVDGGKLIALAERDAKQLTLFDTQTEKAAGTVPVAADFPRALAQLGRCVLVGAEQAKTVAFIDLRTRKTVGTWDLSPAGAKFYGLRSLAADSASGKVYARSNYPDSVVQPGPTDERNSVVLAEELSKETYTACK